MSPQKSKRPIYTRIGRIKPLGKTRRVKRSEARPWRPFRISSYRLRDRLGKPDELVIHRRPSGRPDVSIDPKEAMAVSRSRVRGTLPERIVYKKFLQRRWIYFDFQSSLSGGRLQLGGIVADFILPDHRVIVRVQGPTHDTERQKRKDKNQAQYLADMGYTVYDIDEEIVYDPMRLEDWFRRYIDRLPNTGGRMPVSGVPMAGTAVYLATGEMNFAWSLNEHRRVEALEDDVRNLQRDLERIQAGKVVTVSGLSDINSNLGLVQAGEFRVGNQKGPGFGFSGVRIGYPPFSYISQDWHIAGIQNDVLQFGLRATDGAALFGAGNSVLDKDGITLTNVGSSDDLFPWYGIRFVNDVAAPLEGFIAFRDNPDGDFVFGLRDPDNKSTTNTRFAMINSDGGQVVLSLKAHSAMSISQSDTTKDVELSITGGVNGESTIKAISPDDIAKMVIDGNTGSFLEIKDHSAPGTPTLGYGRFYVSSDTPYFKDDGGTAHDLTAGALILAADFTPTSINSSTSWETIFTFTIPSGTLGANDGVFMEMHHYFVNNTGSNKTITTRVQVYDGTTTNTYTGQADTVGSNNLDRAYPMQLVFQNDGSTSSNRVSCFIEDYGQNIEGVPNFDSANDDITITVQQQMNASSASFHLDPRAYIVFGPISPT